MVAIYKFQCNDADDTNWKKSLADDFKSWSSRFIPNYTPVCLKTADQCSLQLLNNHHDLMLLGKTT